MNQGRLRRARAFSLVELLVTSSLVGLLIALLLPAIQSARESSRRIGCANNLKQLALALNEYENTHGFFPPGASTGPYQTFGLSWLVEVLPFIGESALDDQIDKVSPHNGYPLLNANNRQAISGLSIATFSCPSTSLDVLVPIGTTRTLVMMPSYVGIAGATSHDGFAEERVSPCCVSRVDGEIGSGGVLPPNKAISARTITDGVSRTIVVGEASSALIGPHGVRARADGAFPKGWITGAMASAAPPFYSPPLPALNITTVRYRPGELRYHLPGVDNDHGPNNPLVSDHTQGPQFACVDGHVRSIARDVDLYFFKQLATRDDGD